MDKKFSWHVFFIKLTSHATWAWAISNALTFIMCYRNGDHTWLDIQVIGNVLVTILFIGGKVLVDALGTSVSKAEIKASIGIGAK